MKFCLLAFVFFTQVGVWAALSTPTVVGATPDPSVRIPTPSGPMLANLAYGPHERHRLDLYFPPGEATGLRPVVVWIHGGAWLEGNKSCGGLARQLVSRGYIAASINYRYASQAVFPAQIEDCQRAIRWLRAHATEYGIDPQRIGVAGASAGGYLVALLGTAPTAFPPAADDPNRESSAAVGAVCAVNPPTDFLSWDDQMLPGTPHGADYYVAPLLGYPVRTDRAGAKRASPLTYITPQAAPFFIVHGDNDHVVPPGQSQTFHAALQAAGVDSTLHLIPGADHGGEVFSRGQPRAAIAEFFDLHLRSGLK